MFESFRTKVRDESRVRSNFKVPSGNLNRKFKNSRVFAISFEISKGKWFSLNFKIRKARMENLRIGKFITQFHSRHEEYGFHDDRRTAVSSKSHATSHHVPSILKM